MQAAGQTPRSGPPRLAVMLSGGGRTLLNLLEWTDDGRLDATVALVIASRECPGAEHARRREIPTRVMPGELPAPVLEEVLREARIDWVLLAGYLRRVHVPGNYEGRIVNIHPSLLPKFGGQGMHGRHVHAAVLAAGERESGCTVHLVTAEYDAGPIVHQARCEVRPDDTPDTLAARVFELEKRVYPESLRLLLAAGAPHRP